MGDSPQLEQTLENLEQNNATALAEIQAIQEEITRLEQELANLNNANPEYNANLQELERLKAQKNTLETLATDLAVQMAAKAQEVANAQDEVNALQNEVSNKEQEIIKAGSLGGFKGDSKIFSGEVSGESPTC